MGLTKLDVRYVRNIEAAVLEPSQNINFLVGANGSGKTSLLEAIYILGRGRSFRSNQAAQVISFSHDFLMVSGRAKSEDGAGQFALGVRWSRHGREVALDGRHLMSTAELVWSFPVSLIHPGSSSLLDDAPKYRRQFLDWGVFHLDKEFLGIWRGYVKALRQRNALLRSNVFSGLEPWNYELDQYGRRVAEARGNYLDRLKPFFLEAASHFLGTDLLEIRVLSGWDAERSLGDVLDASAVSDRRLGYTQFGPHRGDFIVQMDGKAVRQFFSRGQIRMLVFSLLLAQVSLLESESGNRGCVLIDDLASELDSENTSRLLSFVQRLGGQFFITATDESVRQRSDLSAATLFHVERGRVKRLDN